MSAIVGDPQALAPCDFHVAVIITSCMSQSPLLSCGVVLIFTYYGVGESERGTSLAARVNVIAFVAFTIFTRTYQVFTSVDLITQ